MDGVTASAAEINAMDTAAFVSMTTATTPASGSCAVQLVFKGAGGSALTVPVSGILYMSELATGLTVDAADTSIATLTNGVVTNLVSASISHFVSDATGKLGLTITAVADDYWIVVVLPNGKLLISDKCVSSA
jgi:hypothetical protein